MITILVYLMLYHDHNHDPRGRSLPLHGLHLRLRSALPPVPLMVLMLASGTAGRCRSMVSLLDYDLRCRLCRS